MLEYMVRSLIRPDEDFLWKCGNEFSTFIKDLIRSNWDRKLIITVQKGKLGEGNLSCKKYVSHCILQMIEARAYSVSEELLETIGCFFDF